MRLRTLRFTSSGSTGPGPWVSFSSNRRMRLSWLPCKALDSDLQEVQCQHSPLRTQQPGQGGQSGPLDIHLAGSHDCGRHDHLAHRNLLLKEVLPGKPANRLPDAIISASTIDPQPTPGPNLLMREWQRHLVAYLDLLYIQVYNFLSVCQTHQRTGEIYNNDKSSIFIYTSVIHSLLLLKLSELTLNSLDTLSDVRIKAVMLLF